MLTALFGLSRNCTKKCTAFFRLKEQVENLYQQIYYDFNIRRFNDKLQEIHRINLSYETVRQILIPERIHTPKKKKLIHRRRRRMPRAGLLVQMDSSEHGAVA